MWYTMAVDTKSWNYYLQILQHCPVPLVIIKGWGQNNNNNTPTKLKHIIHVLTSVIIGV